MSPFDSLASLLHEFGTKLVRDVIFHLDTHKPLLYFYVGLLGYLQFRDNFDGMQVQMHD